MEKKSEFFTLNGYRIKNSYQLTEAMEDYLEMCYREYLAKNTIRINYLAKQLNVLPSSASKMMNRLKEAEYVMFERYGEVLLTDKGKLVGAYLLWRHNTVSSFLKWLNGDSYSLEQVEKIEHFVDDMTITNMDKWLKSQ